MDTSNCIKPPFRSVKVHSPYFRLEDEGIICKVSQSDWAAPVVLVLKKDGSLRVCGDYKMTVKQCADVHQYPLPNTEKVFATLAGGQVLAKLIYLTRISR